MKLVRPEIVPKQVVAEHKSVKICISENIDGRLFEIELENDGLDFIAIDEARKDTCRLLDRAVRQHKRMKKYRGFLENVDDNEENKDVPQSEWRQQEHDLDLHVGEELCERGGYYYNYEDLLEVDPEPQ